MIVCLIVRPLPIHFLISAFLISNFSFLHSWFYNYPREQHLQLQADGSRDKPIVLDQVHSSRPQPRPGGATRVAFNKPQTSHSTSESSPRCARCGDHRHFGGQRCPARGVICNRCNRQGHFQAVCFSGSISHNWTVSGHSIPGLSQCHTEDIMVNHTSSGNKGRLLQTRHWGRGHSHFWQSPQITRWNQVAEILYGPARQTLDALGQFTGTLTY